MLRKHSIATGPAGGKWEGELKHEPTPRGEWKFPAGQEDESLSVSLRAVEGLTCGPLRQSMRSQAQGRVKRALQVGGVPLYDTCLTRTMGNQDCNLPALAFCHIT